MTRLDVAGILHVHCSQVFQHLAFRDSENDIAGWGKKE